jgi:hypothetical protein
MNRAIAVAQIDGPEAGLAILDRLDLDRYRYFHSTRAELRRRADRDDEAHHASRRALDLAQTKPEQRFGDDVQGDVPGDLLGSEGVRTDNTITGANLRIRCFLSTCDRPSARWCSPKAGRNHG